MDSSNDGKVSFEEFCDALAGGEGRSASKNFGPLSLRAGELASKSFLEGHDEEDDQASKARLWNLLHEDIQAQVGGGSNSSPLTLQWKLLRALRNYSDAKEWWESTLRPEVAPDAHWEIEPDRPVLSARELMFAALSDSGQIQQITEEKTATAQSRRTGPRHRSGLKLRMACDGFRLNLEDPLSQLRGQHRLSLGAASDSDDSKAFDLELTYWHATGHRHLSFEDQLKATIVVRGFFSSCMNPCHHHPEFIMESWGFNVCVDSPAGVKALTCRFIADCHFVMNVTSSLLLGVKPIVRTLMPPEDPDAFRGDISQSAGGTAPLAHLLQGLRRLTQEKLQEFKLILNDPDAAGVGTKVPGEEIVQVSTGPPRGLDRRGSNKAKWMIPFELNSAKNLARIMLPAGWHVTELHQTDMLQFELFVEAEARSDPPEPSEIVVWSVDTASAGASAGTLAQDQESNHSPTSRTEEDSPETRSCQSSRTLQVLNRCGVPGEVWFERGSKQRIGPVEVLEADGQPSTVVVPDVRCSLCVGVTEVSVYKSAEARPDLSSFGRCGAPIKALQGIMSSRGAERGAERGEVQSCLTASLSIGPQGQALLELLPPLELQNGTQLPLHLHLHPPYGNHAVAAQMGIFGLTRASAAWAAPNLEPKVAIVPPGGTFQVPLHMLQKVNTESHGFGQHFWQVLAEAIPPKKNHCSLAFAFPLGGSILRSGREELELRRSLGLALETTSITGSGPEKTTLQRFTLLLLPGLRVVNSLPVKLLVVLQREKIRDEHCDVEPGGTADFGRSPFGGKLLLAVEGEEPQVLDLPAEALSDRSKFKDGVDRLNGHIGDR
ncbi:unnamed protein product [Durusdinium trenchii]|uniref:EF-hand domain-containing protein n=1 Tax=Durusdinium trenchii TaxID=1381693 RepID=A0ABP0NWQ2_9DINO